MSNIHLPFPYGFYTNDSAPMDGKYGVIGVNWRPWNDIAEALAGLPTGVRYRGLTVSIAGVEYWWRDGISDAHLIKKFGGNANHRPVILCDPFNASAGDFPNSGGTGANGAIERGNTFPITGSGELASEDIASISSIMALVDNPGQTVGNWKINF